MIDKCLEADSCPEGKALDRMRALHAEQHEVARRRADLCGRRPQRRAQPGLPPGVLGHQRRKGEGIAVKVPS
eukprot:CAMPEP_0206378444 /NCGR_PEP_ID=MMETSP0294-20121207/10743_1 /ASSEMBLY_ACC=CAM_ASM_000327 /TAXON_ID=39354 /ORGANISM="Heterosigma akashiwo, Strain CCMP2393" /LENGTH=71 /DNA_ID=CAMNT_0053827085 /DNA_START=182 /DNA_END=397 /DNA_ORIENTATION=+